MKDKTGNESNSVPDATVQTTCTSLIRSLLTLSLMVLLGKWPSSVESFCWNVEILQGLDAMAKVDQEPLRMCPRKLEYGLEWKRNTVEFHSCTRNNRLETDELLLELP